MSIIIVPEEFIAKLVKEKETVELCSADGRLLGSFTPEKADIKYNLDPGITDEELMRRVAEGGGCTIEEIFAELEAGKYD